MKTLLEAFHTESVLVPSIEIKPRIKFITPDFFRLVSRMTDKKYTTLCSNDIHLSRLSTFPHTRPELNEDITRAGELDTLPCSQMFVLSPLSVRAPCWRRISIATTNPLPSKRLAWHAFLKSSGKRTKPWNSSRRIRRNICGDTIAS